MKNKITAYLALAIGVLAGSVNGYAQPGFGKSHKINGEWRFNLADLPASASISLNDSQWQKVTLPHDWSIKSKLDSNLASASGYLPGGIGWYRKNLSIPQQEAGKKVYLYFEGVYNRSEVFINGHSLGKRPNGYISFMYDATPYIKYGQQNIIAVRVDHSRQADSRWYTGSGIYRNVWLVYAEPVHIAQWGVFAYPEVKGNAGKLKIESELSNSSSGGAKLTVRNELFAPSGRSVAKKEELIVIAKGEKGKIHSELVVQNPELWSTESPALYRLVTRVFSGGRQIDSTSTTTGFRTFAFDPNTGFSLNGKNMKMKGVCIHHDAGVLGAAVPKEVWRKRILTLKALGTNAIRTSHNPQSPDLYALCDELGMLVLNEAFDEWEFPKRKWLEGWNVGKPGHEGSYDFFEEWGTTDLADLVKRDRNHVSVFAWSIGNEVDYPNDPYSHPILDGSTDGFTQKTFGGYKKDSPDANRLGLIAEKLVAVVKELDKSRPVTAGLAGVAMSNETTYPGLLDIAGYNYTEKRYDSDHKKYPERVIYGSENRHDLSAWKAVVDNPHIFGQFLWTGIDYLGESGKWPSRGFYSGLLDFAGRIKPRGYFRQSLWSEKPMAYLGTYSIQGKTGISEDILSQTEQKTNKKNEVLSVDAWSGWNYQKGELISVVCYTNAARAQLTLNGRSIGSQKDYDPATGIIHWDIPFEPGKLEVMGFDSSGKKISEYSIQTPQEAHAIKILDYDREISGKEGVSQIVLQIVDKNGVPVADAKNEILCSIKGGGVLMGLESSNNSDMGIYTDNKHHAHRGIVTAYIGSDISSGTFQVSFSAAGLEPARVSLTVK